MLIKFAIVSSGPTTWSLARNIANNVANEIFIFKEISKQPTMNGVIKLSPANIDATNSASASFLVSL